MACYESYYKSVTTYRPQGRVISYPAPAHNPYCPELYVECAKHLKLIKVEKPTLIDLSTALDNAFWNCPSCVDEREAKQSRWPEGAEL